MKVKLIVGAVLVALVLGITLVVGLVVGMTSAAGQAEREVWNAARTCEADTAQSFRDCFLKLGANPELDDDGSGVTE